MLDLTDQLCDICEVGAAPVHNESSVLLTDLSAAHSQSLKAALLNQGAGIVALRPLEGAAGAGKLKGWLALRRSISCRMVSRIASGSPGARRNTA